MPSGRGTTFITEAHRIGPDATVMTEISRIDALWEVTILIARPAEEPPIRAGDVEVRLFAADGPAPLASAPSGDWVEAGGAAGTTASASFRFEAGNGPPTFVRVTWGKAALEVPVQPLSA